MTKIFKDGCPNCFKALSNRVGAAIINLLRENEELPVMEIVARFDLTQPTISYHLSQLAKVGLLSSRVQGRNVFYRLSRRCPHDETGCVLK